MTPDAIVHAIVTRLPGVVPKRSWGETALFFNPGNVLPHGVYFCTIKEHDGAPDRASQLDREGVFRLAIGLSPGTYSRLFGPRPKRPGKGGVAATGHDFTTLDELMPHPVYAWMGWAQILSPSSESFAEIFPLLNEAHAAAAAKFNKRTAAVSRRNLPKM